MRGFIFIRNYCYLTTNNMYCKVILSFILLLLAPACFAQQTNGRIFEPVTARYSVNMNTGDSTLLHRKSLQLTDDGWFFYDDFSSGSCWTWIRVYGRWITHHDTLVLSWRNKYYPDSVVKVTSFLFRNNNEMEYIDPAEQNIVENWGRLRLYSTFKTAAETCSPYNNIYRELSSFYTYLAYLDAINNNSSLMERYEAYSLLEWLKWYSQREALEMCRLKYLDEKQALYVLSFYKSLDSREYQSRYAE